MSNTSGGRKEMVLAVMALLVAAAAAAQPIQVTPVLSPPRPASIVPDRLVTVQTTIGRPAGLAWQPSSQGQPARLWLTDVEVGRVIAVRPSDGALLHAETTGAARPGPAAFDRRRRQLWTVDRVGDQGIRRGIQDLVNGTAPLGAPVIEPAPFRPPARYQEVPRWERIRGIAVDSTRDPTEAGAVVWTCRGGGLCSTIEVWDVVGRMLLARFFPRCEPEAIAIDPDGRRLWILADNGPDRPMVLIERRLTGAASELRPNTEVLRSRRFLELPQSIRPTAITATADAVWGVTTRPVVVGHPFARRAQLHRFPVGTVAQ